MKGLLLKDYYLIKSVLYIILVVFAVVGIGMSFLTSYMTTTQQTYLHIIKELENQDTDKIMRHLASL